MDLFDDLFYDQSSIAAASSATKRAQPRPRTVPAAPTLSDDLFLTQAFSASPQAPHRKPTIFSQDDLFSQDSNKGTRNRSQILTPSNADPTVHIGPSQTQKSTRTVGIVPPSQSTRRPIFSQKTPFVAPMLNASSRNDVPPASQRSHTPHPLNISGCTPGGTDQGILKLRPIAEIPDEYQSVFPFPYFNAVQSKVMDDVLYTDRPVVVSAPTGSGKTVLFELAIIRLLMTGPVSASKVVYMAPIKALCTERYEDWQAKFGPLGLQCKELTGDTEMDDYYDLQAVNIILTTPEKWDSMTRRWRDNKSLVQTVRLFLIDEVHLLNDSCRGATMEAVVSRMKTVNANRSSFSSTDHIRFMAVSATIPNVEDIGQWLNMDKHSAACHNMDESHRPVRLRKVVLGFPCSQNQSEFKFDLSLNYKLAAIINTYSENKPTLVFCATRKGVQQAAATVVKEARFILSAQHKARLLSIANSLRDTKLRDVVVHGVGFHHAGMDQQDRKAIETAFTATEIPVLMATSTLAMGVNLPAHLVIIKSTQHYVMGGYEEYSQSSLLQMIGRAGRPQFDTSATAVIMTRNSTKHKYESLVHGNQVIESSLHQNLVEHLNAEVVLSTITDISVGLEWIKSTFLYIRIMQNPKHYGLPAGTAKEKVEQNLQELCVRDMNALADVELIKMDTDNFGMKPTETGKLMARYCIAFETMKRLKAVGEEESINSMLELLCKSDEFKDIQLRNNEKRTLNTLNKDKNRTTIRFPMDGKIKSNEMKVNCLIQATLGCLPLQDFALSSDMNKISRSALRISKCMVEVLWTRSHFKTLLNAVVLAKCIKAKLWENSRHIARQLSGIGDKLANMLVNAGLVNFQKIGDTNPREIELIVNRHPPFGNQVKDAVAHLPKYELCIDQVANYSEYSCELTITISILNSSEVAQRSTLPAHHTSILLLGDSDNKVVFKAKLSDDALLKVGTWSKRFEVHRATNAEELSVNFISQDFVGIDVQSTYTPFYTGAKRVRTSPVQPIVRSVPNKAQNKQTKSQPITDTNNLADPNWSTLMPGRRECSHSCNDKASCAHDCCKHGVPMVQPSRQVAANSVRSHQEQIRQLASNLPATPNLKRFKPVLGRFAYTPQVVGKLSHSVSDTTAPTPRLLTMNQGNNRSAPTPQIGAQSAVPATPAMDSWAEIDLHRQHTSATRSSTHIQDHTDPKVPKGFDLTKPMYSKIQMSGAYSVEDFQSDTNMFESDAGYLPDLKSSHNLVSAGPKFNVASSRQFSMGAPQCDPIIIDDEEDDDDLQPFTTSRSVSSVTRPQYLQKQPVPSAKGLPISCYPKPVVPTMGNLTFTTSSTYQKKNSTTFDSPAGYRQNSSVGLKGESPATQNLRRPSIYQKPIAIHQQTPVALGNQPQQKFQQGGSLEMCYSEPAQRAPPIVSYGHGKRPVPIRNVLGGVSSHHKQLLSAATESGRPTLSQATASNSRDFITTSTYMKQHSKNSDAALKHTSSDDNTENLICNESPNGFLTPGKEKSQPITAPAMSAVGPGHTAQLQVCDDLFKPPPQLEVCSETEMNDDSVGQEAGRPPAVAAVGKARISDSSAVFNLDVSWSDEENLTMTEEDLEPYAAESPEVSVSKAQTLSTDPQINNCSFRNVRVAGEDRPFWDRLFTPWTPVNSAAVSTMTSAVPDKAVDLFEGLF